MSSRLCCSHCRDFCFLSVDAEDQIGGGLQHNVETPEARAGTVLELTASCLRDKCVGQHHLHETCAISNASSMMRGGTR